MKVFPDFENEVKAIDPDLEVIPNKNRPGLANIMYQGKDVCPIPQYDIYDEVRRSYTYEFPNGFVVRHKTRLEALAHISHVLTLTKTEEGKDQFFGRGEYGAN